MLKVFAIFRRFSNFSLDQSKIDVCVLQDLITFLAILRAMFGYSKH